KDIRDEYNYPKKKGIKDECSRLLEASTMKSRRGFAIQRLMNAMRQAHADGWFIVFDTLTLADDRLEAFYDNPNRSEERRVGKECRFWWESIYYKINVRRSWTRLRSIVI